ncbi:MAG: PHP domain-containing protein [Desulfurococcaceae archaeon]|jgi:predicted metal-dependent phosphoesterase TrpH|nr:PHP domain-containing protein [Desulfurococcaceae archaeon]
MLLRADLHIHSTFSDGRASPSEILYIAGEKGLDVISITDHDTFAGSLIAHRYQSKIGGLPLVIIGVEVRCVEGDVLVYCEKEIDFPRRIDLLLEKAHVESCLVVPAHPYDIVRLGIGDLIFNYKEWDAIEVWNASSTKGANLKAIKAAQLLGKPGLANSDAHIPEEIGTSYTYIEVDELSQGSIMEAIRKGKVKPVYRSRPFNSVIKRALWSVKHLVRGFMKKT